MAKYTMGWQSLQLMRWDIVIMEHHHEETHAYDHAQINYQKNGYNSKTDMLQGFNILFPLSNIVSAETLIRACCLGNIARKVLGAHDGRECNHQTLAIR